MSVQVIEPRSRRALLAALGGGLAGFAAGAFRGLPTVRAGIDGDVVLGAANAETTATEITNSTAGADTVTATSAGSGIAAAGHGPGVDSVGLLGDGDTGVLGSGIFGVVGATGADGIGVYGSASASATPSVYGQTGVIGQADQGGTAIVGFTGLTEPVPPADTGIYGQSNTGGTNGRGLTGFCATGIGLLGQTNTGVGVRAYSGTSTGMALRVSGKAAFDRSGKLTITAGHSSITLTGIPLTSASFILATVQTNVAGLSIQAAVTSPAGSRFTIYLNKAPSVNVSVAWLAVN
jgi:hypothetical protein